MTATKRIAMNRSISSMAQGGRLFWCDTHLDQFTRNHWIVGIGNIATDKCFDANKIYAMRISRSIKRSDICL